MTSQFKIGARVGVVHQHDHTLWHERVLLEPGATSSEWCVATSEGEILLEDLMLGTIFRGIRFFREGKAIPRVDPDNIFTVWPIRAEEASATIMVRTPVVRAACSPMPFFPDRMVALEEPTVGWAATGASCPKLFVGLEQMAASVPGWSR